MAHFKGQQIFVAHFDSICDVMIRLLGLASVVMAVEVISPQKSHRLPGSGDGQSAGGIGIDLQRKIRLLRI